jgi:di/tricarboxylate transporter
MTVLTNVVSNNAAAVIGTPIAVAIAQQLGINPMPFVLAVLFGANMSFATPFGYQVSRSFCRLSTTSAESGRNPRRPAYSRR